MQPSLLLLWVTFRQTMEWPSKYYNSQIENTGWNRFNFIKDFKKIAFAGDGRD